MQPVADVIASELAARGVSAVDVAVFGTDEPQGIEDLVASFCRERLGVVPSGGLFYRASSGCVVGLRLTTGDDVVLKAYQARWDRSFLRAVQTVQGHVAAGGFPCARPVLAPAPLPGRTNLAMVESWWPDPGMRAARSSAVSRASAAGLARLVQMCGALLPVVPALADHPMRSAPGRLYPEPHTPLFDFEGTAAGAEWIDDLARRAVELRESDAAPQVVAHTDWSARNVRIGEDGLEAVYDWDSVALVPEATALGHAAVTWCVTSEPGGSVFPTLDQMTAYMGQYEAARAQRLSPAQWRSAAGAAAWVLAYTARCEHSLAVIGRARPDQHGARDRLADAGTGLLGLERP